MTCPKCKAKIGVTWLKIATESGAGSGEICYMCGHWMQDSVSSAALETGTNSKSRGTRRRSNVHIWDITQELNSASGQLLQSA